MLNPSTAPNWREMPQFPNLKLLFSSSSPLASLSPSFRPLFNSLTVLSYSGRKPRRSTGTGGGRFLPQRRGNSTLREEKVVGGGSRTPEMEAKEAAAAAGFNRKRAEGRDKPNKPKNLERKVRKVNPVNTICYVQILGTGMDTQDTLPSVLLFFDKQRFIFNAGELMNKMLIGVTSII